MSISLYRSSLFVLPLLVAFASVPLTPTVTHAAYSTPAHENSRTDKRALNAEGHTKQQAEAAKERPDKKTDEDTSKNSHKDTLTEHKIEKDNSHKLSENTDEKPANLVNADPAGNNGTVKVDGAPFDSHPDNEPHVPCVFQIDFYGYDKGVGNAKVEFSLQSPTSRDHTLTVVSGNLTPHIGEDAASGGTDLDASETYKLHLTGAPHDKQGYHVKLTVHAPGSRGSDTKHKVFWVSSCKTTTPVTPTKPTIPGNILGEAAKTTKPAKTAILPAKLPSTGSLTTLWLIGLLTAISTYGVVYGLQRSKKAAFTV